MKKILLISVISFIFLSTIADCFAQPNLASPVPARDNPLYHHLDDLELAKGAAATLKEIDTTLKADPRSIGTILVWSTDNTLGRDQMGKPIKTFNSLYFAVVSDLLRSAASHFKAQNNLKDYLSASRNALLALYIYEALAAADAARCQDISVNGPMQKTFGLRERGLAYTNDFILQDVQQKLWSMALSEEDHFKDRPPNKEICSSGAAKMADLLKQPGIKQNTINDTSYFGGTRTEVTAPEGYEYQPQYIDDKAWQAKREDARTKILQSWIHQSPQ
jgi:hypothetical protein